MTNTVGPILLGIVLIAEPAFSQDVECGDQSVAANLTTTADLSAEQGTQPSVTIQQPAVTTQPPVQTGPIYYSRAYDVRAKIHKYASFTTLPLVVGEFAIGQSLFNSPGDVKKQAHVALGAAIGGLFAVNGVTGVWNLVESRKDPNRGHLPLVHGLLALGANAGFVATAAITPGDDDEGRSSSLANNKGAHRAFAVTSLGLATVSYLIMLIGNR
jgi:hypothetical protein